MNAVRLLFRKATSETVSPKMKKNIRVYDSNTVKRIQISAANADGKININYLSNWHGIIQTRIFGLAGYEVYSKNFDIKPGANIFDIDCIEISDGIFIVETAIRDPREGLVTTYNKIELKTVNIK